MSFVDVRLILVVLNGIGNVKCTVRQLSPERCPKLGIQGDIAILLGSRIIDQMIRIKMKDIWPREVSAYVLT